MPRRSHEGHKRIHVVDPTDRRSSFSKGRARIVETASRLMNAGARQRPTLATIAHELDVSRTSLHYYFPNQTALVDGIKAWVETRLVRCLASPDEVLPDLDGWLDFALSNPHAVRMLVDDLERAPGTSLTKAVWDNLVSSMRTAMGRLHPGERVDAEVHVAWMLGGALQAPALLANNTRDDAAPARLVARFRAERHRLPGSA